MNRLKVRTIAELSTKTESEFLLQKGTGPTTLLEAKQVMKLFGLTFKESS